MSDYISFEIQTEIMKFLPIKSLLQFRSVSKQWNSFITSSEFIADYHVINTHPPEHIFVRYAQSCEHKHVSFVDDDTFPDNKFSLPVLSSVRKLYGRVHVIGSSNGLFLFCLLKIYDNSTALIWNPTIRKSVDIDLGIVFDPSYKTVIGFSVTPHTLDPIIVKVTCFYFDSDYEDVSIDDINYVPWRVKVFKLSSGVWRSPLCTNLPRESIQLTSSGVDINGHIYFLAFEWIVINHCLRRSYLIISFDIKTEEFTEIRLPNSFVYEIDGALLTLSKLKEHVVVFELRYDEDEKVNAWRMENDVQRSVSKLFTINLPYASIGMVLGFRKSGEVLIEPRSCPEKQKGLVLYEPDSEHMSSVGISRASFVSSYVETLLLLNH